MFVIIQVSDTVHIPPIQFSSLFSDSVYDCLNIRYVNRVLPNLGLVICIYSIDSVDQPQVHPIDGGCHVHCKFRLILFRPFLGEILVGRIKSADSTGILISLGELFQHIYLPIQELQSNTYYDNTEGVWVWNYEGNQLYMDLESEIRVKCINIQYGKQIQNNDYDQIYLSKQTRNVYEIEQKPLEEENKSTSTTTASASTPNTSNTTATATTTSTTTTNSSTTTSAATTTTSNTANATTSSATTTTTTITTTGMIPPLPVKKKDTISSFQSAMRVVVSISEDGLGLTSWWS